MLASVARSVVGVDIAEDAVIHARGKYQADNLRFLQGDCANLPVESASIDLVVSFETIEHHDQHEAMMREIRRVLRPGGVLLISSPNRPEYDKTLSEHNPYHVKELDFNDFHDLLNAYFANTEFYAQRVLTGSLLIPYQHAKSGFTHFGGVGESNNNCEPIRPIYFIAVAGDGNLPGLDASVFEGDIESPFDEIAKYSEACIYLSEYINGDPQPYGESRAVVQPYHLSSTPQSIQIDFPTDLQPLARLRLDIANAPAAIELNALAIFNPQGEEIWRWNGGCDLFVDSADMFCLSAGHGVVILSLSDDPHSDLAIPPDVLSCIRGGYFLRIDLTARPLLEALPEVLNRLREQVQPRLNAPVSIQPKLPVGFSSQMEEMAGLLRGFIERKNAIIATQRQEMDTLRLNMQTLQEQLVRAEAQLDLLKEIALGGVRGPLERL
jgi:SAM-dependent methyltransferase